MTAGDFAEVLHRAFDYFRCGGVEGICPLTRLEEDVGVLRGAAHDRTIGSQRSLAMSANQLLVNHGANLIVAEFFNLHHFV